MKLLRFGVIALTLLASACGGNRIRPDQGEPALQSNYPSVEFYACGNHFFGLGQCEIGIGDDVEDLEFRIQTYYKGDVRIFADVIPQDVTIVYDGNQRLDPYLRGRPEKSFVLGFTLTPEFPGESDEPIAIHGGIGFLMVNVVRPGEDWDYRVTRSKEDIGGFIDLDVADSDLVFIESPKCELKRNEVDVSAVSSYRLQLSSLIDVSIMRRCVISVSIIGEEVRFINWMAWVYGKKFEPLAYPNIERDGNKFKIKANSNVSVIALNDKWEIKNEAEFDFDPNQVQTLRTITVKGRMTVQVWTPNGGWIAWMR